MKQIQYQILDLDTDLPYNVSALAATIQAVPLGLNDPNLAFGFAVPTPEEHDQGRCAVVSQSLDRMGYYLGFLATLVFMGESGSKVVIPADDLDAFGKDFVQGSMKQLIESVQLTSPAFASLYAWDDETLTLTVG